MADQSFLDLVSSLSQHFVSSQQRSQAGSKSSWQQFLIQDNPSTTARKLKRLKQICFDGLLKSNKNTDESWDSSGRDELRAVGLTFTLQGEEERCSALTDLVDKLPQDCPALEATLTFLIALKDTGGSKGKQTLGFHEIGDCIDSHRRGHLEAYSPLGVGGVRPYANKFTFSVNMDREMDVENPRRYRLFSRRDFELPSSEMTRSRHRTLSATLPVPQVFSPDKSALKQNGQEHQDEGYSSPVLPLSPQGKQMNIWDEVLTENQPSALSWENFATGPAIKQKPFVSEAEGLPAVHMMWKKCMRNLSVVYPEMRIPTLTLIPEETLCTHLCYLLTGIQSESFNFNRSANKFDMRPGLCILGLSPDSLASMCQTYLEAASIYRHLYTFVTAQKERPWSRTMVGFCAGLLRFLDLHSSSCIYIASRIKNLGKLVKSLRPLVLLLEMLGSICKVRHDSSGWEALPSGIELLSMLLEVSVHVCQEKDTLVLISLFKSAVEPYFRFLKRWLFSGECEHSYKEFGLKMDPRYVHNRTAEYWHMTHSLAQMTENGVATAFLVDIQEKVFRTGKSLALLKIISPDHYLCGRFRDIQPHFMLAVTTNEQINLRTGVDKYKSVVEQEVQTQCLSWEQRRARQRQEERQHAKLVQQRHEEELLRLQKEKEEREAEKRQKQQQRLQDLLVQMKQSKERKEEEKRKRRREEELIEEEAERIAEEERRREAEEVERIREFYERLEREAEDRERRADWRMRRNNPNFKYRRMLLHREVHESEMNKLSKIKFPLPTQHNANDQVFDEIELTVDQITEVNLETDKEGNLTLVCTDSQGNRVELGLDTLQPATGDTSGLISLIRSQPFPLLPSDIRMRIHAAVTRSKSVDEHEETLAVADVQDVINENVPARRRDKMSSIADYLMQDFDGATWTPDRNGNPSLDLDNVDATVSSSPTCGRSRKNSVPIERILYPQRFFSPKAEKVELARTEINLKVTGKPLPYTKSFPELKQPSKQETSLALPVLDSTTFPPLSLILQNSVLIPLRAQQKLVDAALLSQILVNFQLEDHLMALRRYLFLADGEFGRQLVISMCMLGKELNPADEVAGELHLHLVGEAPPPALLCPGSLNRVLESAIAASQEGCSDKLADNLTFTLKENSDHNLVIPGLSLGYRVSWPSNIVLSTDVLSKYSLVLEFMMNIRTCLVSLEIDWANENLVLRRQRKKTGSFQQHRLNIMRHEMLNFVRNLHSYVTAQVLEVSWLEFQDNLNKKVTNLDDLIFYHNKYLNRVLFRCLLNQKAAPVMKIIKNIFLSINKFTSLIGPWKRIGELGTWDLILKQYATFQKTSKFLFGLVTKLSSRGYQPHFQDLLTRLNFNGFYDTSSDSSMSSTISSTSALP